MMKNKITAEFILQSNLNPKVDLFYDEIASAPKGDTRSGIFLVAICHMILLMLWQMIMAFTNI